MVFVYINFSFSCTRGTMICHNHKNCNILAHSEIFRGSTNNLKPLQLVYLYTGTPISKMWGFCGRDLWTQMNPLKSQPAPIYFDLQGRCCIKGFIWAQSTLHNICTFHFLWGPENHYPDVWGEKRTNDIISLKPSKIHPSSLQLQSFKP